MNLQQKQNIFKSGGGNTVWRRRGSFPTPLLPRTRASSPMSPPFRAPRPPCPKMSGTISKTTIPICRTFRTISAFPSAARGFRARFPLVLAERRVPGRGVGTPGRPAQMPVAESFPAHAAGPDRSGLPGRSRQACGGTPRRMVGMGYPGRRSGPGTAGRQRKPAETAAGHHHLVQPLGAFLLPVVSPQQHAHVFRLSWLLAALRDDVALPREVREAAPALADSSDIRAARWAASAGERRGGICAPRHGWRNKRPRTNCSKRPWTTGTAPRT